MPAPRKPTLETLRALHRLHPQAIAVRKSFDRCSSIRSRSMPHALQAKMVAGGRGGYCFEQNLLFASVLRAARLQAAGGSPAAPALDRRRPGRRRPRTHLSTFRSTPTARSSSSDVGFGGNMLTAPLLFRHLVMSRSRRMSRSGSVDHDGASIVQAKLNGDWTPLSSPSISGETLPADYEMGNWFTSAHPKSLFINEPLGRARRARIAAMRLFDNAAHRAPAQRRHAKRRTLAQRCRVARRAHRSHSYKVSRQLDPSLDAALARACRGLVMRRGRRTDRASPAAAGNRQARAAAVMAATAMSGSKSDPKKRRIPANPICA